MRWRMGAMCGPRPGSSLRAGRTAAAPISATAAANARPGVALVTKQGLLMSRNRVPTGLGVSEPKKTL